jgi:hypothetical protein
LPLANKNKIPKKFKKYFWDCEFEQLSLVKYSAFITERILNYGNVESVSWLLAHLDRDLLHNIVSTSKNLDAKTKNYWELMLHE